MRRDGGAYPYALKPDGSIVGASSFSLASDYMRRLALLRLRFFLSYCCCLLDRLGETLFLRCGGNGLCGWH